MPDKLDAVDRDRAQRRTVFFTELAATKKLAHELLDRIGRLEEIAANGQTSTRALVVEFIAAWQQQTGDTYVENWARDLGIMRRLLKALSAEDLRWRMGRYFAQREAFVERAGYSLPVFGQTVNSLGRAADRKGTEGRAQTMHDELVSDGFFDDKADER